MAAGCAPDDHDHHRHNGDTQAPERTPLPPTSTPSPGVYQFLSAAEARTVEAMADRIIPGDQDDPGAVEAGVVTYIDNKLASFEAFAEPTYRGAPFAEPYEGDEPPGPDTDEVIYVHLTELFRYGPRFVDLSDDERDQVLEVLDAVGQRSEEPQTLEEDGPVPGDEDDNGIPAEDLDEAEDVFGDVDPGAFFGTVREDVIDVRAGHHRGRRRGPAPALHRPRPSRPRHAPLPDGARFRVTATPRPARPSRHAWRRRGGPTGSAAF